MKNKNQYTKKSYKKYIVLALFIAGVVATITFNKGTTITYENLEKAVPTIKTVEVQVPEDMLKKQIDEAITASSTAIEAEVKKAADAKRTQMEADIALTVIAKYKKENISNLEAAYKEKAQAY